jgi:hypothetical protein
MKRGFECQRCETVYVVDVDSADVPVFARYLTKKGCADCGGHDFTLTDAVDQSCQSVDEDCECGGYWSPAFMANQSFMLYVTQYSVWSDPTEGAVTPDLSEFFHFCNPELPALVHWARWLRLGITCDHHPGAYVIPVDWAEDLLEAMIATKVKDQTQARIMRLAFHEGFGERDPDQLELF